MITTINEFKNSNINESEKYSNKFVSWFTGTSLNNVKHPIYGNHKLTIDQVKKSTAEYKNKIFKNIQKHIDNGDINKDKINESTVGLEALPVQVYKSSLGDSSSNGITSKNDRLLLVFDGLSSPFKTNEDEDYLVLIKRNIGGKEYLSAKPQSLIESNTHSMFGGNFIFTSDSRFPSSYPIPVHDRVEN